MVKRRKRLLPNKTQLKVFSDLKKIGASTKAADKFIKKHRIGVRKRRRK